MVFNDKVEISYTQATLKWLAVHWKSLIVVFLPLVLLPLPIVIPTEEAKCGYVLLVMAVYWVTEAIPSPVTSLIPVVFFPLLGILSTEEVSMVYMKETNMMFVGGLMIAISIEHCNLHKRIALRTILLIGTSPALLLLGFMLTTMFLSMWISNTACAAMMVPIVKAVLEELKTLKKQRKANKNEDIYDIERITIEIESHNIDPSFTGDSERDISVDNGSQSSIVSTKLNEKKKKDNDDRSNICYYLGVAYASNLGGTGTITGTGTNLVFIGIYNDYFPEAEGINFATWMIFNVPLMLINVIIAWVWLLSFYMWCCGKKQVMDNSKEHNKAVREVIKQKYNELGSMSHHEKSVLFCFVLVVLLWFFREPEFVTGWADPLESLYGIDIGDATAAMFVVLLLFMLPADLNFLKSKNKHKEWKASPSLIDWKTIQAKLPWGIVLLLGGGFALAEGTQKSGLSTWLGTQLEVLGNLNQWVMITIICVITTFLTEVTSNTAIANIMLPVLAEMARAIQIHPLYLMMPCTLCCSYAFMLPVATPPNAIVASAANMENKEMMKAGIVMNFITIALVIITFNTLGVAIYNLDEVPSWLNGTTTTVVSNNLVYTNSV